MFGTKSASGNWHEIWLIFSSVLVDSKNPWSGFPNPLVPSLTHPGGLGNPPHTVNDRWITGQSTTRVERWCQSGSQAIVELGATMSDTSVAKSTGFVTK